MIVFLAGTRNSKYSDIMQRVIGELVPVAEIRKKQGHIDSDGTHDVMLTIRYDKRIRLFWSLKMI